MTAPAPERILLPRALNRPLLERQRLLGRATMPALDMVPAPPRFLPDYDNVVLGHADRERIAPAKDSNGLAALYGAMSPGTLLVDGFVRGPWTISRVRSTATLTITTLKPLTATERVAVEEEGARLLAFAADGHAPHIRFTTAV